MDETYNQGYLDHIIEPLSPEILIPIHWDDFTTKMGKKKLKTTNLLFNLNFGSNLGKAFDIVESGNPERCIKVLPLWDKVSVDYIQFSCQ